MRHVATGDRIGSLLVNPGGPGGSGYDFVADSLDYAVGEPLKQRFDVVGFDPRGVGRSSAVACYDAAQMDDYLYGIVPAERGSDEWIDLVGAAAAEFGEACSDKTGDLLGQVDTVSAARDLDLLRAILGDEQLNYLGYSYGTFLGATYADLYPDKVGRLVLDGAIDPSASDAEVNEAQAVGFEQALRAYLEDCLDGHRLPVRRHGRRRHGRGGPPARIGRREPAPRPPTAGWSGPTRCSPRSSTRSTAPSRGRTSARCSSRPCSARPTSRCPSPTATTAATRTAPIATTPPRRSARSTASTTRYQADVAVMREKAAAIAEAAPTIGPYFGYGDLGCVNWPYQSDRERAEIHAEGAAPILVVGTTGDPATPYEWAVALADQLDSGVLVSYEGEGHTAYNKSNACVSDAVEGFLIDGTVPASDPMC